MRYTFGTSDTASNRLEEIARFFNPLSIQFIRKYVQQPVGSVIDLGCGPGFTTSMLAQALKFDKVYGIDSAPHFLKMAKERFPQFTFVEHDVTKTPFLVRADVMYSRFLLSHLRDVVKIVNGWAGELFDRGILIIEELEDIDTEVPVFQKYIKINIGLVASQGAELYVGKVLTDGVYQANVVCNEPFEIPVENYKAATWFYPNTTTIWDQEKYVLDITTPGERKEISDELLRIKEARDTRKGSTWKLRRLVLKRT